ncbi:MAG: hypothetical protein V3T88_03820 [Nitrosomonadaceae bacterium]
MEVLIASIAGQLLGFGILVRWLQIQTRDNKKGLDKVYTKDETREAIDLRIKPITVGIDHVKEELKEMKHMIGRLLDAKNKD